MTGVIIVFVLHNLLLIYLWEKSRKRADWINKKSYWCLFLFYIFLALLGLQSGDYTHHIEEIQYVYQEMSRNNDPAESMKFFHMEPIYNYLAYWVQGNYLVWRAVVFGLPFVAIFYAVKKLKLKNWEYFLLFTLISFSGFIVGRMYMGVAVFFCAVACARYTGKMWYLLFALLALFAHKCLYVLPAFIPLAYIKFNKKSILLISGAFVIMIIVLQNFFEYLGLFVDYDEGFLRTVTRYEEESQDSTYQIFGQSTGEKLIYMSKFIAMLITTIYLVLESLKRRSVLPDFVQSMLMLGVAFFILAIAFYIVGLGGIYTWRYLTVSWFPLTFVMCYYIKKRLFAPGIKSMVMSLLLISFEAGLTVPIFYASVRG